MTSTHYPNPPILEAIIHIAVSVDKPCSLADIERYGETVKTTFPIVGKLWEGKAEVTITPDEKTAADADFQVVGYRFETADGPKRVLQVRPDSMTFSWLSPYDRWEPFRDEAHAMWEGLLPVLGAVTPNRVSIRYLNRIDIPVYEGALVQLEQYFTIYPHIPENPKFQHKAMANLVLQVQVPQPDLNGMLTVSEARVAPAREGVYSILLDIDVSSDSVEAEDEPALLKTLERLRMRKNEAFESFITDSTRELFQ